MSENKFTPGPWGCETVRTSCGVCHKVGPWPHKWRAGETMSACIYDDYPTPDTGTDTMLANARLIAAAPELYEALKAAIECNMVPKSSVSDGGANRFSHQVKVADQIRAALAKAEGRS